MADPTATPASNAKGHTAALSREDILCMARIAGLDLPPAYQDELVEAYGYVRTMIACLPVDRPRGDEPAQVFDPTCFLPAPDGKG